MLMMMVMMTIITTMIFATMIISMPGSSLLSLHRTSNSAAPRRDMSPHRAEQSKLPQPSIPIHPASPSSLIFALDRRRVMISISTPLNRIARTKFATNTMRTQSEIPSRVCVERAASRPLLPLLKGEDEVPCCAVLGKRRGGVEKG